MNKSPASKKHNIPTRERGSVGNHQAITEPSRRGAVMKKGWETKTLDEACLIKPPKSEARAKVSAKEHVSFLPMEAMGIDEKYVRATQTKALSSVVGSYTYFADGDVLLAKITPCFENGKLGIAANLANGIGFGSSEYLVFRPDKTLSKEWLYYYLSRAAFRTEGAARMSGAVGHKRVSKDFIEGYPIPIPPLAEQQRIVGLLDEAFEGIATAKANAEKNLRNARALFESHLQSVFSQRGKGWVEKSLEQIGKTQTGSTPKTSDQSQYGDFISFVKPGDFNTDGTLDYDKDGLSESGAKGARKVPAGSVLMVCIGATIGKCGYCDQDVTTNQQINSLTPADGSSHRFLYYQMLTESFQRSVIHRSGQATLPIINKSKWSALTVWLPPTVAEQKHIAATFDALVEETQRLASLYTRKLAALEALKKSLLHQAFSGEL
jgi:type I restriction enzyme S subunit